MSEFTEADLDRTERRARDIFEGTGSALTHPAGSDDGDTMLALVREIRRLRDLAREALR